MAPGVGPVLQQWRGSLVGAGPLTVAGPLAAVGGPWRGFLDLVGPWVAGFMAGGSTHQKATLPTFSGLSELSLFSVLFICFGIVILFLDLFFWSFVFVNLFSVLLFCFFILLICFLNSEG